MIKKKHVVVVLLLFAVSLASADLWQTLIQDDFNEGTYTDTTHNGSAVILDGTTSGTYTSKIFNATSLAEWNGILYASHTSESLVMYVVDNQADVWKSDDNGTTWSLVIDDYNDGVSNSADDLDHDGTYFYILQNQDVWRQSDPTQTFTKINDDFNGGSSGASNRYIIHNDSSLFIVDGAEDVYISDDSGVTFVQTGDNFNGGNGDIKGFVVDSDNVFFAVDGQADVWNSTDTITWELVKDDYSGAEGNGANNMIIDSDNNLFIVEGDDDVWKSDDSGVTWTKVNDDYNGEGQHVKTTTNIGNDLYIIEGDEDVWKSDDSGVTWTKASVNLNGGNGNVNGATVVNEQTSLSIQVRSCDDDSCDIEAWTDLPVSDNQYFQYKVLLSTTYSATPELYNVSIDYTLLDTTPPNITIHNPTATTYETTSLDLKVSADEDISTWKYSFNDGNTNQTFTPNTTITAQEGANELKVYAQDLVGNEGLANVSFTVTIPSDDGDDGGGSPGGGGGSSGGGGAVISTCTSEWSCSEWYECIDGTQARTCIDVKECTVSSGKPAETRDCKEPHCSDRIWNFDEESIDCGGRDCDKCNSEVIGLHGAVIELPLDSKIVKYSSVITTASIFASIFFGLLLIFRYPSFSNIFKKYIPRRTKFKFKWRFR